MHIDFKFDTQAIRAQFERLAAAGKGRDITRKMAGVLRQESKRAFDNEESPEGEKWPASKTRLYRSNITNVRGTYDKFKYKLQRHTSMDWHRRTLW